MKRMKLILLPIMAILFLVHPMFASLDLVNAAWNGNLVEVNRLLKSGANVNTRDNFGWTPLMYAVSYGHGRRAVQESVYFQIAQLLLSRGADIHVIGNKYTAFTLCAKFANSAMLRVLAAKGAKMNITHPEVNYSAVMWAAARNNYYALETLVALGADVKGKGVCGNNALHLACKLQNSAKIVDLLLKIRDGIDINERNNEGDTGLILAVQNGSSAVVQLLIKKRADVNAKNSKGETALMHASYANNQNTEEHVKIVRLLLNTFPDINIQDNSGRSALLWATGLKIVQLLTARDNGARVELQDKTGKTALIRAVEFNLVPILKYLISFRADVNATDYSGRSALDYALDRPANLYNREVVDILKRAGAKRGREIGR